MPPPNRPGYPGPRGHERAFPMWEVTEETIRLLAEFDGRPGFLDPRRLERIERAAVAKHEAAYARLAENGTIDPVRYHDDPIYHAIVHRLRREQCRYDERDDPGLA